MIHGKTTIAFYDKNTNKLLRKYTKDNMVTNAANNIVAPNFSASCLGGEIGNLVAKYTPLRTLFGGLLMFDNEVDSNVIIPGKNEFSHFIGCAGGDYQGSSIVRGYMDASKSEFRNDYIKEVYRFGLDKCNHDIKTICLSSISGGSCGLSKLDDTETSFFSGYAVESVGGQSTKCHVGLGKCDYIMPFVVVEEDGNIIGTDEDGNIVCIKKTSETTIVINKFKYKNMLGFTDTIREINNDTTYTNSLSSRGIFETIFSAEVNLPCSIVDQKDLTIYKNKVFSCKNDGNGTFICAIISMEDNGTHITYGTLETDITDTIINCKTIGNEIYAISSSKLYVIKVPELGQGGVHSCVYNTIELLESNLTPIPFKDTVMLMSKNPCEVDGVQNIYFLTDNNTLLKQQVKYANATSGQAFRGICFNLSEPLVGMICEGEINGTQVDTISVNVVTPYLSTINVLTTSQYKAATEELEITYELTMDF